MNFGLKFAISAPEIHTTANQDDQKQPVYTVANMCYQLFLLLTRR